MKFKAIVYDTQDKKQRVIIPKQILLRDGTPYAVFSQNSMRYEQFHLWDDNEPCKYNNFKESK
jgi:hypothetical protein